jgi:maleylacetoacetate isomerase
MLKLYSYFRSSSAYRVRIALNLKAVPYEVIPVHLLHGGGDQHRPHFVDSNPARLVPVLKDGSLNLTQSLAIIEYLDETYPAPPLLPADPAAKAWVRALALDIVCEIQPLNNLRALQYLKSECGFDEAARASWSREWISRGFTAIETKLTNSSAEDYCHGKTPTVADCCLIPQVFNAHRVKCQMERFPNIMRIYEACMSSEAFRNAAPGSQIDAE